MFKLWKRVCAGMLAAVTLGVTLLPGVEVHAATDTETDADNLMKICVISDTHYYPLNYAVSYTHLTLPTNSLV